MKKTALFASMAILIGLFSCDNENSNKKLSSIHGLKESHNNGMNCIFCHVKGGSGEGYFTIAGTVYDTTLNDVYPNATLKLYSGPNGTGNLIETIEVDGNGNFYTTKKVDFSAGLYPGIVGTGGNVEFMPTSTTVGACNSCHGVTINEIFIQ